MTTHGAAATRASGEACSSCRPGEFTISLRAGRRDWLDQTKGFLRDLHEACFDRYRPERHYMRGPGPRCRAKQGLLAVGPAGN